MPLKDNENRKKNQRRKRKEKMKKKKKITAIEIRSPGMLEMGGGEARLPSAWPAFDMQVT